MNLWNPLFFLTLLMVPFSAKASNSEHWETSSEIGTYGLVGVAFATPAYRRDLDGLKQAGYSIVAASATALFLKTVIDEERPDESGNDSFPSNHAASAFAAATTLQIRHGPKIGVPAYGIATLAGVGRVRAGRHYWKDVIAGSLIGSLAGWACTDAFGGDVQVAPWAGRNEAGLTASLSW